MNDIIEIYKAQLIIEQGKLFEISEEIVPLEQKKIRTEKKIKALELLIGSEETAKPKPINHLTDKSAIDVYKELAKDHFKEKSFKEKDIREIASEKGLRVRGELIAGSYSRAIISRLLEKGFLEKVAIGSYKYKKSKAAEVLELIPDN